MSTSQPAGSDDTNNENAPEEAVAKPKKTPTSKIEALSRKQASGRAGYIRKTPEELKKEQRRQFYINCGILLLCGLVGLMPVFGFRYAIGLLVTMAVLVPIYLLLHSLDQLHLNFSLPKHKLDNDEDEDAPIPSAHLHQNENEPESKTRAKEAKGAS